MWDWHGGWAGWTLMMVAMAGFWALLVAGVVLAVRGLGRPDRDPGDDRDGGSRALSILEDRFARGEIDEEEFRARRAVLATSRR